MFWTMIILRMIWIVRWVLDNNIFLYLEVKIGFIIILNKDKVNWICKKGEDEYL